MKSTNTFVKLFSSVSTLAVVAGAMFLNGGAWGQASVLAWGCNLYGECNIPNAAQSGVTAVAGGYGHTVALKGGAVLAWGAGTTDTVYPNLGQSIVPTTANSGVSAIACGNMHTSALKDGAVLAWGAGTSNTGSSSNYGQSIVPSAAQSGVNAIACGAFHTVALKNGAVLAWGAGTKNSGEFGVEFGQSIVPVSANSGVTAIAGVGLHTTALKNGAVLAWGYNYYGQCTIPAAAQSGVTAIAGGYNHTIALKDGAVLAWGLNDHGACSIPVAATSGVTAIAGGYNHSIALKDGAVLVWGRNDCYLREVPAIALSGVSAIAGGAIHNIVIHVVSTITGVLPISGPSSGDTNITITGTNFEAPARVTIGGAPATNVVLVSDSQITATTPAGFPGPAVVTVNLGSSTAFYYRPSCGSDLDNNGVVDSADLGIVLLDFGNCYESAAAAPQEPMIFPIEAAKPLAVKK